MRVLVVTNMYPPHHYGGYEQSCRDVVVRWSARGHEVTVLTTTMRVSGVDDTPGEDVSVRRTLEFYWRDHVLQSPSLPRRLAIERHNQAELARALADLRPDVVSVWNMGGMSLGLLTSISRTGIPMVLNVCDDWLIYGQRLDAWSRLFARRARTARLVSRLAGVPTALPDDLGSRVTFCFVSDSTRARARQAGRWPVDGSTVVYSGIDRADFPPRDPPATARPWRWQLLYVGRIDERKGISTVIDALPLLPEARLSILGRGDDAHLAALNAQAERLGVASRLTVDAVARGELSARYEAADVVVFPPTWNEPFGLVPVEAMACATPVVATGTGGSAEFLHDERNCLLFEVGDAEGLAAAVRRLAGDAALRQRLATAGLDTAAALTVDALADCLEEWHVGAARGFADGRPADRPPPP